MLSKRLFFWAAIWAALLAARDAEAQIGKRLRKTPRPAPRPQTRDDALERALDRLHGLTPKEPKELMTFDAGAFKSAAQAVEDGAAAATAFDQDAAAQHLLTSVGRLLEAKAGVDASVDAFLKWRAAAAHGTTDDSRRQAIRNYLAASARLLDLSGRLRYVLSDALRETVDRLAGAPAERERLIELVLKAKSSIGATALVGELFPADDAEDSPAWRPVSAAGKLRVLDAIAASRQHALLPVLTELLAAKGTSPQLVLRTAEVLQEIGLPQDPRPDDAAPPPPIVAATLRQRVAELDAAKLDGGWRKRREALLQWLDERIRMGVAADAYRVGAVEVRAGDWLLMRNPSPFNLFTDLSPGLFTHVGVVAVEQGADGLRRFVVVDVPEQGARIPAANVETYLERTLNYVFLRHPDPDVAKKMGDAARDAIGNESQFDLNFRTDRVAELAGQPLAGKRIHTYCAGLLLLCALQTDVPRETFFPVSERPAGGRTAANLARLGITVGDGFVSPTGAMFSPALELAGRREPMYDPSREIEEAVFDHFADRMQQAELVESPDLFQWLRQRAAEASRDKPALARLLAQAADVDDETDLAAAARAASVVEALDQAAFGASGEFVAARDWLRAPPVTEWEKSPEASAGDVSQARNYQTRHAALYRELRRGAVSPRQLRQALVDYYIAVGTKSLDERFFPQARENQ